MLKPLKFAPANAPRLGDIFAPQDNSFNFLRLTLATLVLISHSYLYLSGSSSGEPLTALTGRSLGEYAVQTFFILSGVMVAQSLHRSRSIVDFATARLLRIFPGLIVCVLLTALILGPLVSPLALSAYFSDARLPLYIAKTMSLSTGMAPLPEVFTDNPISGAVNTSLWTLKYEVICYIVLAGIGMLGLFERRRAGMTAVALAVFVAVIFYAPPADPAGYTFHDTLRYFAVFFGTGVLAYLVRDRLALSAVWIAPLLMIFAATRFGPLAELGSALFLGYAALWASTKTFGPMRAICNRIDLSYGVYIYAGPAQLALIHLIPGVPPMILSLLGFLIAAPAAALSWVLVERPSMSLRPVIAGLVTRSPAFGRSLPAELGPFRLSATVETRT